MLLACWQGMAENPHGYWRSERSKRRLSISLALPFPCPLRRYIIEPITTTPVRDVRPRHPATLHQNSIQTTPRV